MADQTEVAEIVREADQKIHQLYLAGKITQAGWDNWVTDTGEAVTRLLGSVVDR